MTELVVWPGWIAGAAIGVYLALQYYLTGKPLGCSSGYGNLCGLVTRTPFFRRGEFESQTSWRLWFGAPLVQLLRRREVRALFFGKPIEFQPKPMKPGLLAGALLLGVGWGLAAACPGTVLTMLGEGKLAGLFTIAGILLGTWLYGAWQDRRTGEPNAELVTEARTEIR